MSKQQVKIEPSILAADFSRIAEEVKRCEEAGADALHLDIMDGHFVRNLSFGPRMVEAVNRVSDAFLDVHLMIYTPYDYIEHFVQAGADAITIHFEATEDVIETLDFIRRCNVKAGLAFCPSTSESLVVKFLDNCDHLLLMTVPPGFGGQPFERDVLEKIRLVRSISDKLGLDVNIQVDGGINPSTAKECREAGANYFVVGSWLFAQENMGQAINQLRESTKI